MLSKQASYTAQDKTPNWSIHLYINLYKRSLSVHRVTYFPLKVFSLKLLPPSNINSYAGKYLAPPRATALLFFLNNAITTFECLLLVYEHNIEVGTVKCSLWCVKKKCVVKENKSCTAEFCNKSYWISCNMVDGHKDILMVFYFSE